MRAISSGQLPEWLKNQRVVAIKSQILLFLMFKMHTSSAMAE